MKLVTLPVEQLHTLFELRGGDLFWRSSGTGRFLDRPAGRMTMRGYRQVMIGGQLYLAHRVVFAIIHGYWPNFVDHINGKRADNRPENLREVTPSQSVCNRGLPKNNKSGIKGVWWDARRKKWTAQIAVGKKMIRLGRHDDLELAVFIRECAEEKYHGVYARTP